MERARGKSIQEGGRIIDYKKRRKKNPAYNNKLPRTGSDESKEVRGQIRAVAGIAIQQDDAGHAEHRKARQQALG